MKYRVWSIEGLRKACLAAAALILAVPWLAEAAAPRTWSELAYTLVSLINTGAVTLMTLAFVVYFYGISSNILNFEGDTDGKKRKSYFVWGVIILFVMMSIWGILRLLQNTFLKA